MNLQVHTINIIEKRRIKLDPYIAKTWNVIVNFSLRVFNENPNMIGTKTIMNPS